MQVCKEKLISLLPVLFVLERNESKSFEGLSEPHTCIYSKTCLKRPLQKKTKIGFQDRLSLNACPKYCRMLQALEHSAILSTFIKLPFVINMFVLSIFEWPLKTGFTISLLCRRCVMDKPFALYSEVLNLIPSSFSLNSET